MELNVIDGADLSAMAEDRYIHSQASIKIYDKLSKPDPLSLKPITGGRLKGKTDINPQWRYRAMTEMFGLCGIGWKYTIDRQWTEPGANGEVLAFVNISVYVKHDGMWSEAIPGTGGSTLIAKEKESMYNSDEAFKMATTDALSVAMKMLGVASAIYAGQWDGTKYIGQTAPPPAPIEKGTGEYIPTGTTGPGEEDDGFGF
jgi:hypothetical protein